jgi:hypothetical protein
LELAGPRKLTGNRSQFVDGESRKLQKVLLSLRELKGSHSGAAQAEIFLDVISVYKLRDKIGYFTLDNAGNNDTMLQVIARAVDGFDATKQRLRCNGHIINLAVQAFLFGKNKHASEEAIRQVSQLSQKEEKGQAERAQTSAEWRNHGVLGLIHNIVIWIRSSDKRYNEFKRRAGRIIPRDNDTRWNSWFMMISVALQLRHKISEYVEDHYNEDNIRLDHLSPNQWQELQELHDFLQPFYEVTKGTQFDDSTLDKVLFDMDYLVSHFKQAMEQYGGNADSTMMERLMVGWYKFDDYYQLTDDSPVYAASLLLHPSLRKRYLTTNWAHQPGFIEPAIQKTRDLWQQYKPTAITAAHLAALTPYQRHERKMYGYDDLKDEFERFIEVNLLPSIRNRQLISLGVTPLHREVLRPRLVA